MAEQFVGKWNHVKSDNLDEFLKALGVGMVKRKMATSTSPSLEISVDGNGCWTVTTHVGIKTQKSVFKLGEPFENTGPAGNTNKVVATLEDGKLVVQPVDSDKGAKVVREIIGDQLIMTMTKGNVEAKRTFKKA